MHYYNCGFTCFGLHSLRVSLFCDWRNLDRFCIKTKPLKLQLDPMMGNWPAKIKNKQLIFISVGLFLANFNNFRPMFMAVQKFLQNSGPMIHKMNYIFLVRYNTETNRNCQPVEDGSCNAIFQDFAATKFRLVFTRSH